MKCTCSCVGAATLVLISCGGGGGGTSTSGGAAGTLAVLDHSPSDDAVQVPLVSPIRVDVDGPVVRASLDDPDSALRDALGHRIPCTISVENGGTTIVFAPLAPFAPQAMYAFTLSPLTCDDKGRILDEPLVIDFRTFDDVAPRVIGCSIADGQTGVSRTNEITIDLDEPALPRSITSSTVAILDAAGQPWPVATACSGARLHVAPIVDLPGDGLFTLRLAGGSTGVRDAVGNPLAATWSRGFHTATDLTPPAILAIWPDELTAASPLALPRITFTESIDRASIAGGAIVLVDEHSIPVPCQLGMSADQRSVLVQPGSALMTGGSYGVLLARGVTGPTDVSGNPLAEPVTATFTVGSDATSPTLQSLLPTDGSDNVSLVVRPEAVFGEALAPDSVTMALTADGVPVPATVALSDDHTHVRLTPLAPLQPDTDYILYLPGGANGVRDVAGNGIATVTATFRTTDDATIPVVHLLPANGSTAVPTSAAVVAVFDTPVDPGTVDTDSVLVEDAANAVVAGQLSVARGNRVVRFVPHDRWTPGARYTVTVRGGLGGIREPSGNCLPVDVSARFWAGNAADTVAPTVSVTLNETADIRKKGMWVSTSGFTVDVTGFDPDYGLLDMSSTDLIIQGGTTPPSPEAMFAGASLETNQMHVLATGALRLDPAEYSVVAGVRDLSGNLAQSAPLAFRTTKPDNDTVPFERIQVVWVRFDMDRDGNGRGDFEDDLVRLGLATAGDPAGTNARMLEIVRDGTLAAAHAVYGRDPDGSKAGAGAVGLRMTDRRPLGLVHAQIACGGLDPEGRPNRVLGDPCSGALGRAYYDHKNRSMDDRNVSTDPGLGVFGGEVFLFEARVHLDVYPAFLTLWGKSFMPLCPELGGTPVGRDPDDATVLSPTFDYATATAGQRERYDVIFTAADDWATAIGLILAHEVGHTAGLVTEGPCPGGLHGDTTLHNDFSTGTDVMGATASYDALVLLGHEFRDLNKSYLRHRLLQK